MQATMMQFGKINQPINDFLAQRQILALFINSQRWEMPFSWDWGRDPDAIDPVEQLMSAIAKHLLFTVDDVEVEGDRVTITLKGKKFDVSI